MKQYHPTLPNLEQVFPLFSFWPDYIPLFPSKVEVDRVCVDRLLLIRERMIDGGLMNSSILDLGGGSGYFSWLLYLTAASKVDIVEDQRAKQFGYNDESFTTDLIKKKQNFNAESLFIHDNSIERFLSEKVDDQKWDITICLSVLHHFITGYGDNKDVGLLSYDKLLVIFELIGKITRRSAFIEIDPERIQNYEKFMRDFMDYGCFDSMSILGSSHSSIGVERNIVEFCRK
jgi:hypothetical protein